jgi:hypothetical protein
MATKKQRRRREKLQRHEYEYVVETDEGEEVVVEPPRPARGSQGEGSQSKLPQGAIVDRRGRVISRPSWGRVLKRGAIFGPLLLVLMFALGGDISTTAKIVNAVVMLAIFLPMSYLTDMLIYRSVAKRQQREAGH